MSSFSPARRGVGYCCASSGVAFVPLPAAPVVLHGMSCCRLPFGGSATFLAPGLSCSCSGALLWGLRCLGAPLGFLPCAVLFLRGLQLAQLTLPQVTLGGFLPFLSPGACPTAALVASIGRQPFPSIICASAPDGLQGFAGFCTLGQGAPFGVVSAL